MDADITYDEKLWFFHINGEGKHYILGNPHTFRGRFMAWSPLKQRSLFVSKSEVGEHSEQTKYWLEGFLHGSEPEPPRGNGNFVDFRSQEYKKWLKATESYRATGSWNDGDDGT